MLNRVKLCLIKFLAVCLTAVLFFSPLEIFGISPESSFQEGKNAFSFSEGSWGEYVFQPAASGVYLVEVVSSGDIDCYVSIKGTENSYTLNNIEGTRFSFLLKLTVGELCYLDLFSLFNQALSGSVTITYRGEVTGFSVVRQPEKKVYIADIDAIYYRGEYMIAEPDLTGCAVKVQLKDGSSLLFENQAVKQFIPLKNYGSASLGRHDLAPDCMGFLGSIPIEIREATQKERIGAFAILVRQYYAFESDFTENSAASALFFAGQMSENNADRMISAAFRFAGKDEPHLYYRYADPKTNTYRIPEAEMQEFLSRYFAVSSVTPEYSSYYYAKDAFYILPMEQNFPEPDTDLILASLLVRLMPDGTWKVSSLYGGKSVLNGQIILTLAEKENGYYICGVEWGTAESILLKPDSPYQLEDLTGFVVDIPLGTALSDFVSHFEDQNSLLLRDLAGNPVTTGFVGTCTTVSNYDANGILLDRVTAVVRGDLSGDGTISTVDYMRVRKLFMKTYAATPAEAEAADVNNDGKISSVDYMRIKKHFNKTYVIR